MSSYNELQISFSPNIETYNSITDLLGTKATNKDLTKFPLGIPGTWTHTVILNGQDPYFDFINNFLDILENKYEKLEDLGIQRNDISVWLFYEYDSQCNMEFDPLRLKRLGDNGITLCISCWDSGLEYDMKDEKEAV